MRQNIITVRKHLYIIPLSDRNTNFSDLNQIIVITNTCNGFITSNINTNISN